MQHLNTIKGLIQKRHELNQEIARIQVNRLIAVQRARVQEIDQCTADTREISKARKDIDRLISVEALRLGLPEQFCVMASDGNAVHTVLVDTEESTVAVFRTVSLVDALVDVLGQPVKV